MIDSPIEPNVSVRLGHAGTCVITHGRSRTALTASTYRLPHDGDAPSDTDLVAAALGASVLASIEELIERAELPREQVSVHVTIKPRVAPTRLTELWVRIALPVAPSELLRLNLTRAAETCYARRAIDPRVKVLIAISPPDELHFPWRNHAIDSPIGAERGVGSGGDAAENRAGADDLQSVRQQHSRGGIPAATHGAKRPGA